MEGERGKTVGTVNIETMENTDAIETLFVSKKEAAEENAKGFSSNAAESGSTTTVGQAEDRKIVSLTGGGIGEVSQQTVVRQTIEGIEKVPGSVIVASDAMDDSEHVSDKKEREVGRPTSKLEETEPIDADGINITAVACDENQHEELIMQSSDLKQAEENTQLVTQEAIEVAVEEELKEESNNQINESAGNATPEHVAKPKDDGNSQHASPENLKALSASNNENLSESISSSTKELIQPMDTENNAPTPSTLKVIKIKTEANSSSATGLGLLAQYNSDSDVGDADCEDDVMEVPASKEYRNKVVEIESESESESTSSDDSDVEYLTTIRKEIEKTIDLDDDEDDDEEGDGKKRKKPLQMRVKGEMLLEDLPPIQDLHITVPEEECIELGRIHSIIDQLLLVSVIQDSLLLDLDTVLFLDKGKRVLGEVFDVLGQVADPMYCVRFNSHKEIEEKNIKIGDTVYVAPKTQYTQFVILSSLMKLRGSDASWENDVEPPPRYLDYSDDEQEREARAVLRNKDRPNDHQDLVKRSRGNGDDDATSSSSVPSTSQSTNAPYVQRSGRFNRERVRPARPPNQYQRNQAYPNATHFGSWHSNYRQSYPSYHNPHMMPQQTPNAMPSPYPYYSPGPYAQPPMSPVSSPAPLPMYVLNPLAVVPPRMANNRSQYHAPQQMRRSMAPSPPPAPPGLD